MPLQTLNVRDHLDLESLFAFCADRRVQSPHYVNVDDGRIYSAYLEARKDNLRYNRKTNVMRDDRLGVLARPSDPSEWEEATVDETREYLCREIWCSAVAQFNREHM